jgi:site-specific recombinase XerD
MEITTNVQFFDEYLTRATNYSMHTKRAYQIDLNDFIQFLGSSAQLEAFTKDHIRSYIHDLRSNRHAKETTIKSKQSINPTLSHFK